QPRAERLARPEPGQVPERLHERLLHDVVRLLPGAKQERGPVRAQRVPGDQHAVSVKVAVTGPGYRLRVVDGSPYLTQQTGPEYTATGGQVLTGATRHERCSRSIVSVAFKTSGSDRADDV